MGRSRNKVELRTIEKGPLAGCKLFLPNRTFVRRIINFDYEPPLANAMVATMASWNAKGGHLLDIGAHVGYFALMMAKLAPQCTVDAFEPVQENLEFLKRIKEENKLDNLVIHEVALSDKEGTLGFLTNVTNATAASMGFLEQGGGLHDDVSRERMGAFVRREVPTKLFDSFGIGPVTGMKLDVEGAEAMVLRGAKEALAAHKPDVFIETHTVQAATEIADLLIPLGFTNKCLDADSPRPAIHWFSASGQAS
jgi:FkbM family methyltransferase